MDYFLGIDGGGTKTKCACINSNLEIIFELEGGPSNPLIVGYENSATSLINLIEKIIKKHKILHCTLGISGCGRKENSENLRKTIIKKSKEKKIKLPEFNIISDIEIAHEGAFNGSEGTILIIGTGSILFSKNKNGEIFIAGGYGRLIGDEGSGYSIGKKGLQAASKSFDGRIAKTILTDILKKKFSIKNRDELIKSIYNNKLEIQNFAPDVIEAAEKKDRIAQSILEKESDEIVLLIKSATKFLGENFKLCLIGNLISDNNFYSRLIKEKIKKKFKRIKIIKPKYSPEIGAALLAKKLIHQKQIEK